MTCSYQTLVNCASLRSKLFWVTLVFSSLLACSSSDESSSAAAGNGGADNGGVGNGGVGNGGAGNGSAIQDCNDPRLGQPFLYDCSPLQAESYYVKTACGGTAIAFFQTDAFRNYVIDDATGNVVFIEAGGLTTPCKSGTQICPDLTFSGVPQLGNGFVPLAESSLCTGQGGVGGAN